MRANPGGTNYGTQQRLYGRAHLGSPRAVPLAGEIASDDGLSPREASLDYPIPAQGRGGTGVDSDPTWHRHNGLLGIRFSPVPQIVCPPRNLLLIRRHSDKSITPRCLPSDDAGAPASQSPPHVSLHHYRRNHSPVPELLHGEKLLRVLAGLK